MYTNDEKSKQPISHWISAGMAVASFFCLAASMIAALEIPSLFPSSNECQLYFGVGREEKREENRENHYSAKKNEKGSFKIVPAVSSSNLNDFSLTSDEANCYPACKGRGFPA